MSFEGHSEEMSPQAEGEWLDYINEFEMQFENARQITVRERIGNPEVKPLAQILVSELADELDRLLGLLSENNIAIDFLHEQDEREMYRFITEEMLDEETDDIQIPGMFSHFIYEEFHPNDEDDITDAIEECLYALFQGEFKDPESMFYYTVSNENLQDADGKPLSLEEFKALVSDFHEAYPVITSHAVNVENIIVGGDHAAADANIEWQGMPKNEKAILRKEGSSEFRLARSIYGGWDITRVNIPGWIFRAKS
jgi:hypothetical protein